MEEKTKGGAPYVINIAGVNRKLEIIYDHSQQERYVERPNKFPSKTTLPEKIYKPNIFFTIQTRNHVMNLKYNNRKTSIRPSPSHHKSGLLPSPLPPFTISTTHLNILIQYIKRIE